MQVLPSQQPRHVPELQVVPPKQVPPWQVWPAFMSQPRQYSPALPHWVFAVPALQSPTFTSTHPAHAAQAPATQVLPLLHVVHAAPPVPHRCGVVTVMHVFDVEQQPVGQFVALHTPASTGPPPVPPPPVADPPPVPPPAPPSAPPVLQAPPNGLLALTRWQVTPVPVHGTQLIPLAPHCSSLSPTWQTP